MNRLAIVLLLFAAACGGDAATPVTPRAPSNYGTAADGRLVAFIDAPIWCSVDRFGYGLCDDEQGRCDAINARVAFADPAERPTACTPQWVAACSLLKSVMTDRVQRWCFPSIPQCDAYNANRLRERGHIGPEQCSIYRMRQ